MSHIIKIHIFSIEAFICEITFAGNEVKIINNKNAARTFLFRISIITFQYFNQFCIKLLVILKVR